MDMKTYAQRAEMLRPKLYRTALCWLGDPCQAVDVLDEAVYRGLCAAGKFPMFFYAINRKIIGT